MLQNYGQPYRPSSPDCFDDETPVEMDVEPIIEIPAQNEEGEHFQIHCSNCL